MAIKSGPPVAFSPDGRLLVTSSDTVEVLQDGTLGSAVELRIFDIKTGIEQLALEGHDWPVYDVEFTPNGTTLVSADEDYVRLWSIPEGRLLKTIKEPPGGCLPLDISSDGRLVIWGCQRSRIRIWNLLDDEQVAVFEQDGSYFTAAMFSPDGKFLALYDTNDEKTLLWHLERHRVCAEVDGYPKAFSQDGKILLTVIVGAHRVKLWHVPEGDERVNAQSARTDVLSWVFSPNGSAVFQTTMPRTWQPWWSKYALIRSILGSGAKNLPGKLYRWDLETNQEHVMPIPIDRQVGSMVFSPDGKLFAIAFADNTVELWEVPDKCCKGVANEEQSDTQEK